MPWGVAAGPAGDARVRIQGKVHAAEEVSAHILRHLRRVAEQALGQLVDAAVITVPAYFNDHQRQRPGMQPVVLVWSVCELSMSQPLLRWHMVSIKGLVIIWWSLIWVVEPLT